MPIINIKRRFLVVAILTLSIGFLVSRVLPGIIDTLTAPPLDPKVAAELRCNAVLKSMSLPNGEISECSYGSEAIAAIKFRRLKPDASMARLGSDGLGVNFIDFKQCKFDFDSFFGQQKYSQLGTMDIDTCEVSGKIPCANMPDLTRLTIVNTRIRQPFIASASSLTHLSIEKCEVGEDVQIESDHLPKIRTLSVDGPTSLRKSHFVALRHCKSLDALYVHDNPNVTSFFDDVENSTSLVFVTIIDSGLDDSDCISIGMCVNVEFLDITGNPITATGINSLSNLKSLKTVCLKRCLISEDVAVSLARLPKLKILYVDQALVEPMKRLLPGVEVSN